MRLSIEHNTDAGMSAPPVVTDPTAPNLGRLANVPAALHSFFDTVGGVLADNPVPIPRLQELAGKARAGQLSAEEAQEAAAAQSPGRSAGARRSPR
jgi:hypothetical protein